MLHNSVKVIIIIILNKISIKNFLGLHSKFLEKYKIKHFDLQPTYFSFISFRVYSFKSSYVYKRFLGKLQLKWEKMLQTV